MNKVIDRIGRTVTYRFPPKKIVSLCPGITETLYAIGLKKEIVGRTRYCIYPKKLVQHAITVGGTKQIEMDKIISLRPDLIFVEKEENNKEIVETLEKILPVYVHEVQSIDNAYRMIEDLGELCNRKFHAQQLVKTIQRQLLMLPNVGNKRAAYVIWQNPYMVVGRDTYINSLLEKMGFINPFTTLQGRYPVVTKDDFLKANLDYIFLASEPFPFTEQHQNEFHKMVTGTQTIIVDGEMFWYGVKMIEAAPYFKKVFQQLSIKG